MAKKGIKYYIPGAIALVLGIAAFCMMFLTAVTYSAIFSLPMSATRIRVCNWLSGIQKPSEKDLCPLQRPS